MSVGVCGAWWGKLLERQSAMFTQRVRREILHRVQRIHHYEGRIGELALHIKEG